MHGGQGNRADAGLRGERRGACGHAARHLGDHEVRAAATARVTTSSRPKRNEIALDLTALKGITVNAGERTAEVQAGATWAELDAATQAHGLATPGSRLSRTSVVSAVLGRAQGWLTPLHGTSRHVPHDLRCETAEVSALTAELLRHFEDTSTALRVLVPKPSGWTVHEGITVRAG
ncbi:FAD-binding protein [Lentzea indica]|uniref:FAD-binding protein n=1 Tax=Lentzea indica TaxID=2604800 RepID=UPI001438D021